MKRLYGVVTMLFAVCMMTSCSSDEDSDLSRAERTLVGCWQVVEQYSYGDQVPVEGIKVIEFKSDRTAAVYKDGELLYETQFWAKPAKNSDGYYLYHDPDEDYTESTYSCTFEVSGSRLTIREVGCFNVAVTVYQRISSLSDVNPDVGVYQYEEHPTALEGTWYLVKANFGFGGIHEFAAGDVTVQFFPNHTMRVINKEDTKEMKPFMDSGYYPYEIIKTDMYNGIVYTTISIDGNQCTFWFSDGMMTLDFGMAFDAPGYFFKKLKL